jgi:hypothetical protein
MIHQNFQSFGTSSWVFEDGFCSKVVEDADDTRVGVDKAASIARLLGIAPQGEKSGKFKCGLSVPEASRMVSDSAKKRITAKKDGRMVTMSRGTSFISEQDGKQQDQQNVK